MIKDILYCLLGYSGGVFIEDGDSFRINPTYGNISDSEKMSLQPFCDIGYKVKNLKEYSNNFDAAFNASLIKGNFLSEDQMPIDTSVFTSGIVKTIQDLISEYEVVVENLENKFYSEKNLTINDISSKIFQYNIKFEKLFELIQNIYEKNLRGGEFLNFIYQCGITGDPVAKDLFKDIFINCNIILNNMISMWIINSTITSNEFFIASANNFIIKEKFLDNADNEPGNNPSKSIDSTKYFFNNQDLESWSSNYYIEKSNVPFYLPNNLVEDILFVGKAIKILKSNKNSDECKLSFNVMSIFHTSLEKLNTVLFKQSSDINNLIDIEIFNKVITLIKNCVSKFLWKLVVNNSGFVDHLIAVKNIFLTFHGEFFHNFICKIQDLLNSPNFDKAIEDEINDVYFKGAMKEVFHLETNPENNKIYEGFRIKLISSGFNYDFQNPNEVQKYLNKKEINFIGGFNYDTVSSSFRLINTIYKSQNGALWNNMSYDLDEEFLMNSIFNLKNFSKIEHFSSNENVAIKDTKLIKKRQQGRMDNENQQKSITINYIIHIAKNFPNQLPLNLKDLENYFNFSFELLFSNPNDPSELTAINFRLSHVNKLKSIMLNIPQLNDSQSSMDIGNKLQSSKFTSNYRQINEHEIEIYNGAFTNNNLPQGVTLSDLIATNQSAINNIQIMFKDNFCTICNQTKKLNFAFPFNINQFIPKDKRKIYVGIIFQSQNLDVIFENVSWNFNFFSGEIYNENSNLILIQYNPPWPHNFIFNENILKMYNQIFNLVFPLKTSLTMLNQLWIEKKKICFNMHYLFKLIDCIHSRFTLFLQNLISFFMFDVIEVKFKAFFEKIPGCKDLEDLMKIHEEFLSDVTVNSFVKSKKIMRTIFDVLFAIRKFHNYVQQKITNINESIAIGQGIDDFLKTEGDQCIQDLKKISDEFNMKVDNLIHCFMKIKNTKHFNIISQLLAKIELH
ncbi:MAG: hypothetical protein MJ252_20195 [archaeon]|nr:hypothetical protein [archaeon]